MLGVAQGLSFLHQSGIVHGDIKARNVVLDTDDVPKICDFGMTKTSDYRTTSSALKGLGTSTHMAPELLNGVHKTTESDVFAFAMTLVEVCLQSLSRHSLIRLITFSLSGIGWERDIFQPADCACIAGAKSNSHSLCTSWESTVTSTNIKIWTFIFSFMETRG